MRTPYFYLFLIFLCLGCTESVKETPDYTARKLEYQLYQASEYKYTGKAIIREYAEGGLEVQLELDWDGSSTASIDFPAHLHFGEVSLADAPMAFMLNPVNSKSLVSRTPLGKLADGSTLDFEKFQNFDGHIKVHLASEGPDYKVILVAGNVGKNSPLN